MNSYPKIAEEYAAETLGPKLAKTYGVGSTQTIYLILETVRREQRQSALIMVHPYTAC